MRPIPYFPHEGTKQPGFLSKNGKYFPLKGFNRVNYFSPTWWLNPENGIGFIPGENGYIFAIDTDAKDFPPHEDCDRIVEANRSDRGLSSTDGWLERTGGGGYREIIAIPFDCPIPPKQFSYFEGGNHHGEFLQNTPCIIAPSQHTSGNRYRHIEGNALQLLEFSPSQLGIFPYGKSPAKGNKTAKKRTGKAQRQPAHKVGEFEPEIKKGYLDEVDRFVICLAAKPAHLCHYFDWLKRLMVADWLDDPRAIKAVDDWSSHDSRYVPGEVQERINSFTYRGVGMGWLINDIREYLGDSEWYPQRKVINSSTDSQGEGGETKPRKIIKTPPIPTKEELPTSEEIAKIEAEEKKRKKDFALSIYPDYLTYSPDIILESQYVELPTELGNSPSQSLAIKSPLGSGKTQALGGLVEARGLAYDLWGATNNLMIQSGKRLQPFTKGEDQPFHLRFDDKRDKLGDKGTSLVYCVDQLPKAHPGDFKGKMIIIDELQGVLAHLLYGSTLKGKQKKALQHAERALQECESVILLDANLTDNAVDLIEKLSSKTITKIENKPPVSKVGDFIFHKFTNRKGKETLAKSSDDPLVELAASKRCFEVSDSKKHTKNRERLQYKLQGGKACQPATFALNADSASEDWAKECLSDFRIWVNEEKPSYFCASPTITSGVDFHSDGHFECKIASFYGVLRTDNQIQLIARLRDNLPTHVSCSESGLPTPRWYSKGVTPNSVRNQCLARLNVVEKGVKQITAKAGNAKGQQKALAASLDRMTARYLEKSQDDPWFDYYCVMLAQHNIERLYLRDCLKMRLETEGHNVWEVKESSIYDYKDTKKEIKEELEVEEAKCIYNAEDISEKEYEELRGKEGLGEEDRYKVWKHRCKKMLPGIENTEVWGEDFILETFVRETFDIGGIRNLTAIDPSTGNYFKGKAIDCREENIWKKRLSNPSSVSFLPSLLKSKVLVIRALDNIGFTNLIHLHFAVYIAGIGGDPREDGGYDIATPLCAGGEELEKLWETFERDIESQIALGIFPSTFKKPSKDKGDRRPVDLFKKLCRVVGVTEFDCTKPRTEGGGRLRCYSPSYDFLLHPYFEAIYRMTKRYWEEQWEEIEEFNPELSWEEISQLESGVKLGSLREGQNALLNNDGRWVDGFVYDVNQDRVIFLDHSGKEFYLDWEDGVIPLAKLVPYAVFASNSDTDSDAA